MVAWIVEGYTIKTLVRVHDIFQPFRSCIEVNSKRHFGNVFVCVGLSGFIRDIRVFIDFDRLFDEGEQESI